jgi:hypothetical protein
MIAEMQQTVFCLNYSLKMVQPFVEDCAIWLQIQPPVD